MSGIPFYVPTVPQKSGNNRPADTQYVDIAVANLISQLQPIFSDTPPDPNISKYWVNTQDGQLYLYWTAAKVWVTANSFTGGNSFLPLIGGTISGTVNITNNLNVYGNSDINGGTIDNTVIGASVPAAATVSSLNGGPLSGFRNRLINGDFRIDQRNSFATFAATTTTFGADRWRAYASQTGKLSSGVNSTTTNLPNTYSIYLTSSSNYTLISTDYFNLSQYIEGINTSDLLWGTNQAKPITISFYVASNIPGVYSVSLRNGALNLSYVTNFTITTANISQYVSITIPGCTTGTWLTGAGTKGLLFGFDLGTGSTYKTSTINSWVSGNYISSTNSISLVSNITNNLTLGLVQLEMGTVGTPFETRNLGSELQNCQRYYETSFFNNKQYCNNVSDIFTFYTYFKTSKAISSSITFNTVAYNNSSNILADTIGTEAFRLTYTSGTTNRMTETSGTWIANSEI